MATSSIFASFDIRDKKTAERFVEALDESSKMGEWQPTECEDRLLTDKDEIAELVEKWRKNK